MPLPFGAPGLAGSASLAGPIFAPIGLGCWTGRWGLFSLQKQSQCPTVKIVTRHISCLKYSQNRTDLPNKVK
jgi:hypothetical protein